MKTGWVYYQRVAGEIVVVVTIGLVLGTALHQVMNDWSPSNQPDARYLRGQPTSSLPNTVAPLHVSGPIAPARHAPDHTPGALSLPDRPPDPSTRPPKHPAPIPTALTAQVVLNERRPTTVLSPIPPPSIPPTAMVSLAPPLALPEEDSPFEDGGDLAISGVVLNKNGEPVSNLEITASTDRLFEEAISDSLRPPNYHAHTDDNGFYEFPQLFDAEYMLQTASTPSYQPVSKRVRAGTEEVTLVVTEARSQKIQGLVTQADSGAPLAGILVTSGSTTITTDDAGHYLLAVPLPWSGHKPTLLRFSHPGYWDQQRVVPASTHEGDNTITMTDLAMAAVEGKADVRGTVESQVGDEWLAGVRVFLTPAHGPGQRDTLTDQNGIFHFSSVPWGAYTLTVAPKTDYQDLTYLNLQVTEAGVEDLHLQLTSIPRSMFTGQLVDPLGQPVRDLTLWLTSRTVRTFTGKPITSDASGYFLVHDVPVGEVAFNSRSDPHLSITGVTLQADVTPPISLPVDWGQQTLTGQVLSAEGIPIPALDITLTWTGTDQGVTSRAIRHTSADATGTFRFSQLGPGRHTLNVNAKGYVRTILDHEVGPDHPTVEVTLAARSS